MRKPRSKIRGLYSLLVNFKYTLVLVSVFLLDSHHSAASGRATIQCYD